jgi:hypothetical protein
VITADVAVVPVAGAADAAPRARRLSAEAAALWQKFPPRAVAASWPATQAGRGTVVSEAMTCPYAAVENDQSRYSRRLGVLRMLDWLETQPGATSLEDLADLGLGEGNKPVAASGGLGNYGDASD